MAQFSCRTSGHCVAWTMMAAMVVMGVTWGVNAQSCPSARPLVWSACYGQPVVYTSWAGEYTMTLPPAWTEGLAPEWDETNSTYYVRRVPYAEAATYAISPINGTPIVVGQSEALQIVNVASYRCLAWRQEGDEKFLIETESETGCATFQFLPLCRDSPMLPCIAYYLFDYPNSSLGLSPYLEDGAVYFKQSSDSVTSFALWPTPNNTSVNAAGAQHLASVV